MAEPPSPDITTLQAALKDRYLIERELGRGGMAAVYLARDLRHDRAVAIKVLARHLGPIGIDRFQHEIRVAARLTHPHVLGVHDSGEADGLLYYVMPYVAGETLRARLDREGALPVADVAFASGFGSVRQFNDTIREVYERSPLELRATARLRRRGRAVAATATASTADASVDATGIVRLRLPARAPFDAEGVFVGIGGEMAGGKFGH